MKTFLEWCKQNEVFFTPPSVPEAELALKTKPPIISPAPKPYRTMPKEVIDFFEASHRAAKNLDKLATYTKNHPQAWGAMYTINPKPNGLTHQEQLESFIQDFQNQLQDKLNDPLKFAKDFQHANEVVMTGSSDQEEREKSWELRKRYINLFKAIEKVDTSLFGMAIGDYTDPEEYARILSRLDSAIFNTKNPESYQKAVEEFEQFKKTNK